MKQKLKESTGITLVALVVTIVVLLILAGITITYVLGDNSIFKLAQDAKNKTEEAKNDEQEYFNNIGNTIDKYINGNGGGSGTGDRVDVSTITTITTKNILAKDSLENPITIPEGFKVVPNGQDGVEYTYTGDKKPTVQDGIVIEDNEGNQFVWIPVGNVKNKDGSTNNIQLARYTFDITLDIDTYEVGGTGAVKQTILDGSGIKDEYSEYEYLEDSTSETPQKMNAKNIEEFKTKSKAIGGYYLARYEASKGEGDKVKSKSAAVWNVISHTKAARKAREMYDSNCFESDLVNSYAWDSAIVFIQTYSGDSDYSKEVGSTTIKNTGTSLDKRCNIYDMASNAEEWTTETYTKDYYGATTRSGIYTSFRGRGNAADFIADEISFRPILYVK